MNGRTAAPRRETVAAITDIADKLPAEHLALLLKHADSLRRLAVQAGIYYSREDKPTDELTRIAVALLESLPEDKQRVAIAFIRHLRQRGA